MSAFEEAADTPNSRAALSTGCSFHGSLSWPLPRRNFSPYPPTTSMPPKLAISPLHLSSVASAGTSLLIVIPKPFVLTPNALSLFISGFLNDRIFIHLSRNNSGFAEPEFRLWILLPISLLQATGLLLYGLGLAHSMPWIVPAVGMGFNGFCIVSSISVIVSYVIDCYKDIAEEAITSVLLIRALFSTGFTFAIQPWITHSGLENTFIAMAMIAFTGLFSAAVFIRWGKSFRRMTAQRYIAASLETLQLPHVTNT
jgi:hypothetical protein